MSKEPKRKTYTLIAADIIEREQRSSHKVVPTFSEFHNEPEPEAAPVKTIKMTQAELEQSLAAKFGSKLKPVRSKAG